MRYFVLLIVGLNAGCTSAALRDHAVNQTMSLIDQRYQEVLDNLANVQANRGIIPSFAVISSGTANVTDTLSADPTTLIDQSVPGFSKETLNVVGTHNPELQWTVVPVVAEPNLEALKYACLWVIEGRPDDGCPAMELLRAATRDDVIGCGHNGRAPGFHFDVANQLDLLPDDWLHIGSRNDVPRNACYKAHCGKTYVWVEPDGLEGLSTFTLVVLDIATTDPKSLVLPTPIISITLKSANSKDQITEQWSACQAIDGNGRPGPIKVGRPRDITATPLWAPPVEPDDTIMQRPQPPTPKLVFQ